MVEDVKVKEEDRGPIEVPDQETGFTPAWAQQVLR